MSTQKLTPAMDKQISIEFHQKGETKAFLAKKYGVSPRTIGRAIDRHVMTPKAPQEQTTTTQLLPGDCVVVTSEMSDEDFIRVRDAFLRTGAGINDLYRTATKDSYLDQFFGWDIRDNEIYDFFSMFSGTDPIFTRVLSVDEIIGGSSDDQQQLDADEEDVDEEFDVRLLFQPYSFMMSDSSITIWKGEEQETINKDNPKFDEIKSMIFSSGGTQEALHLAFEAISTKATLEHITKGKVEIDPLVGVVTYMDRPIPLELEDRIVKASQLDDNSELDNLVKFTARLYENPYSGVIEELYDFLEACDIKIGEDGFVIAYKVVRENYKDIHSGKFDNSPGAVCEMPRVFVDRNSFNTCSAGLHVCSKAYLPFYGRMGSGSRVVQVSIDPADFVSVPNEYWGIDGDGRVKAKARVCRYTVLRDVTNEVMM